MKPSTDTTITKHKNAKAMMIASMAVFGTLGIFTRNIAVTSGELALYRAVLAISLIAVYLTCTKQSINLRASKKELVLLLFSGAAIGINWILLFEAYKYTTISAATLSYYFAPVIVTVVCPILFHEKLTGKQIFCFIMSTLGLIMITGTSNIRNIDGIHRTFLQFLSAIIILVPYVLLTSGIHLGNLDIKGWGNLLIVGLFHTGITYCMYFSSLKELAGQEASILSYIDPLVAVLISVLILGETMSIAQVIGGVLILGFTLWNELTPHN